MKGKYFFKENGKEIEIKEFDYEYVRNALLKEYKSSANRKYCYTIVVDRTYDSLGNPVFDVRKLDLNEIYFDTTKLRIQALMLDEIMFDKSLRVKDLPMPALQKEYKDWKEGKTEIKQAASVGVLNIPVVKKERVPVDPNDVRVSLIQQYASTPEGIACDPVLALDWIENYDVCNRELAIQSQGISEKKIQLAGAIKANSEYLHTVFDKLRITMEELFPLKPTFMQKIFGGKTDLVVKEADLNKVPSALQSAVQFDHTRFEGIKLMFDDINKDIASLQENIVNGTVGCGYQIANVEDKFEWELGEQRLQKVAITTEIMQSSLVATRQQFMVDFNRMNEVQTILIPLVVDRLQSQVGQSIDTDTERTIRILAYGASDKDAAKGSDDTSTEE